MGNESPPESAETVIGEVEVAVIAVQDEVTGETVPLEGADGGLAVVAGETLSVALDEQNVSELDVNVASPDVLDVDLSEQSLAELDVNLASPDVVDVDLSEQSVGDLGIDLSQVGGTAQSGEDIAAAIASLEQALASNGGDTIQSDIFNTGGTQIDPATNDDQPNFYDEDIVGHDLDADGDYTIPEQNVRGTGDIIVKVASADTATFTVTVEWTDGSGNVLYAQEPAEATDVTNANLKFNVASDHVQLTITDDSGGTNTINGTVNVH